MNNKMFFLAYLFSGPPSSSKTPETFYRSQLQYSWHTVTHAFQIGIIENSHTINENIKYTYYKQKSFHMQKPFQNV